MQKQHAFQEQALILSRSDCCFCRRRPVSSDVERVAGAKFLRSSASVCVRRASEARGRLIKYNGKDIPLISVLNCQYIIYSNQNTYLLFG